MPVARPVDLAEHPTDGGMGGRPMPALRSHLHTTDMMLGTAQVGVAIRDLDGELLPATGFMTDMTWRDHNAPNHQNQRSDGDEAGGSPAESY